MIKNGRLSVTETRDGDTVVSNLTVPVVKERLEALQRQVDALKAKNAELEKALQDCKARR